jgi:hypothetical protein
MIGINQELKGRLKRVIALEPSVLKQIGEESKRNGTHRLSSREIDRTIRSAHKETRRP